MIKVLVGVTGAIATVAIPQFLMTLRSRGYDHIDVVMSASACRFIPADAMRVFSGRFVHLDLFEPASNMIVPHVELTRSASVFLVMPATANILAKAACGIADDLVSSAIVAATCPIIFAPSMNGTMWANTVVQRNISDLRSRGCTVMEPTVGIEMAGFEVAYGGMAHPSRILDEMERIVRETKDRPSG